jgi:hypothetical protein
MVRLQASGAFPSQRGASRVLQGVAVALAAGLLGGCVLAAKVDPDALASGVGGAGGSGASGSGGSAEGGGGASSGCTSDAMCNDGKACTLDVCVAGACVFDPAPIGSSCADDDACNGDETCDASAVCQDGAPKLVDDGDSCTTDTCDGATGLVSHQRTAGCLSWTPLATTGAPSPRQRPAHVWTGSKLLVWGGGVDGQPFVIGDGAAYDPASDSWSPLSTVNAPSPREGHVAVWTGSKMVVWGGADLSAMSPQGAVYDPAADTWTPMSTAGQPTPRVLHSMVWTGKKVVVWGGLAGPTPLSSGGLYDPETNTWASLPQAGAPSQRFGQSGVWAYDRLIVWGGQNTFDWLDDGRSWLGALGAAGQWVGFTSTTNAPSIREGHSALWTGHRMLVWGGWNGGPFLGDGASFDPASGASGTWSTMSAAGAPSVRRDAAVVWTGSEMFLWGGLSGENGSVYHGDGGLYRPDLGAGTWTPIPESPVLSPRHFHAMVWTGSEVLVWGGESATALGDGARVKP